MSTKDYCGLVLIAVLNPDEGKQKQSSEIKSEDRKSGKNCSRK
jgi:hypothetical protein